MTILKAIALFGISVAIGCSSPPPSEPPSQFIAWTVVQTGSKQPRRNLTGVVKSALRADVGFEVAGKISALKYNVGDSFKRGQTLATLEPTTYSLRSQQQKAAVASAMAQLARAESEFKRVEKLLAENATTQAQYDNTNAEFESAKAQLALSEASHSIARKSVNDTRLVAPYDGRVTGRHAEPAEQVRPQQPVLSIQRADSVVEIAVSVPETLIRHITV
ncbi:MAG: efflux RND transporter periplasmic adaptor subunit, partial [Myxococcota bacterium]